MAKAGRQLAESLALVDIVIEVLDARIPRSSGNPEFARLLAGKRRFVALCKEDLADPARSQAWKRHFERPGGGGLLGAEGGAAGGAAGGGASIAGAAGAEGSAGFGGIAGAARAGAGLAGVAFVNAKSGEGLAGLRDALRAIGKEKAARLAGRGVAMRPARAMVVGIPNSGKSTLINKMAGRAVAATGDRPGVTRARQWARLGGGIELLDTPGVLWPKFEDERVARNLAFTGAIRDEVLDQEDVAGQLLVFLAADYPALLAARYGLAPQAGHGWPSAAAAGEAGEGAEALAGTVPPAAAEGPPGNQGAGNQDAGNQDVGNQAAGAAMLAEVARRRGFLLRGGALDTARAAAIVLDEFRAGKVGRVTLEAPGP
jgi:ribosome biogenesis GTPase A